MIPISRERAERLKVQLSNSIAVLTERLATIEKKQDKCRYWNTKTQLVVTQQRLAKLKRVMP